LTCVDADELRSQLKEEAPDYEAQPNGISVDQVLAQQGNQDTPLASLQTGLASIESHCGGRNCSISRCISWSGTWEARMPLLDPAAVFDSLFGVAELGAQSRALNASLLDGVLENAANTRKRLGVEDRRRLDQFLESVRALEKDVASPSNCPLPSRPDSIAFGRVNGEDGYDRQQHSRLMNRLIALGLQCDRTRIVSHMLDHARTDFEYDHVNLRAFSASGSTPLDEKLSGSAHGLMHSGEYNDAYATLNWWNFSQVADLAALLDSVDEGEGTLLDQCVISAGSPLDFAGRRDNLPLVLVGGGGGRLKTDQHLVFSEEVEQRPPLRDLYYTLLREVFDVPVEGFGASVFDREQKLMTELLT
jgi:hypothetical protein